MADGADDRGPAGRHRPDQCLIGKRQQVLNRPAATGNDDHVDRRVGVKLPERPEDLRHGMRSLDRGLLHPEFHRRPPNGGVAEHVALGGGVAPADQADHCRQEWQRPLAFGGEQALRRE